MNSTICCTNFNKVKVVDQTCCCSDLTTTQSPGMPIKTVAFRFQSQKTTFFFAFKQLNNSFLTPQKTQDALFFVVTSVIYASV